MKTFECEICNFKAVKKEKLEEHTKAVHLVQKDIQCPHCDFKTAWKRSIYDHIKLVHRKEVCKMI